MEHVHPTFATGCSRNWYKLNFYKGRRQRGTTLILSLQNKKNEANLLLQLGIQKLKGLQLQGRALPHDRWLGVLPWTPLGTRPPDHRSASLYRLALCARHICVNPTFLTWRRHSLSLRLTQLFYKTRIAVQLYCTNHIIIQRMNENYNKCIVIMQNTR